MGFLKELWDEERPLPCENAPRARVLTEEEKKAFWDAEKAAYQKKCADVYNPQREYAFKQASNWIGTDSVGKSIEEIILEAIASNSLIDIHSNNEWIDILETHGGKIVDELKELSKRLDHEFPMVNVYNEDEFPLYLKTSAPRRGASEKVRSGWLARVSEWRVWQKSENDKIREARKQKHTSEVMRIGMSYEDAAVFSSSVYGMMHKFRQKEPVYACFLSDRELVVLKLCHLRT